jgi:hypothetical protein
MSAIRTTAAAAADSAESATVEFLNWHLAQ